MSTCYAKLVAKQVDHFNYTTLVFQDLNTLEYIMCVMFPNWEQSVINLGDKGFVTTKYVQAGIDKWFDGTNFIPYKYTNVIFIKFIRETPKINLENIVLD